MAFATMAVGPELHLGPGSAEDVWVGTFFWIVVHGGIAAALFAATVSTFDRCLGRVEETSGFPDPRPKAKPAPRSRRSIEVRSPASHRAGVFRRRRCAQSGDRYCNGLLPKASLGGSAGTLNSVRNWSSRYLISFRTGR